MGDSLWTQRISTGLNKKKWTKRHDIHFVLFIYWLKGDVNDCNFIKKISAWVTVSVDIQFIFVMVF